MTLHRPLTVGGDQSFSLLIFRNSLFTAGGNPRGRFALGLVQSEWKVYVKRHLDREEQDIYFLNITATDGLFVTQAMVEVTVSDVNDNSPVCDQVGFVAVLDCCLSHCFSKIKSKPISFFSLKPGSILFLSPWLVPSNFIYACKRTKYYKHGKSISSTIST